tara:strand:- start:1981 stop:3228 length:1248 start_codon:yes stop_codon:yes gene_type:complete
MFWIIETSSQLDIFRRQGFKEAFVEVIPFSPNIHPTLNPVSLIYVRPLINANKGYMICLQHNDAFQLEYSSIQQVLADIETIHVRDKKEFLHYFIHKSCHTTPLPPPPYIHEYTQTHEFYYRKYPKQNNINCIIPLVKHYEYCEILFSNLEFPPQTKFRDKADLVFNLIEKNGLKLNQEIYNEYFNFEAQDCIYTQYSLDTTTMRPSNKFGGINFAALNKSNGEREAFIPHNDSFLDIDISAYHPTLLAKVIGFEFPEGDIHQAFAEMYGVDYKKSKELTFKQLYGGVFKQYEHLEFFRKVKEYTSKLWGEFENQGYIECPISKYKFEKDKLENMNPQKLLNYLLQNLETSNNVRILYEILKLLRGKNTKLVLYVYDSFLLDIDKEEDDTINEILDIFKKHNLNIKIKKGINYNF